MPLSGFVQIFGHSSSACAAAPWSYRLAPLPPRSTTTDPLPPDSGSGGCVRMELSSGGCVLMELRSFPPVLGIAKEVGRADMADATNATTLRTRPPPGLTRTTRVAPSAVARSDTRQMSHASFLAGMFWVRNMEGFSIWLHKGVGIFETLPGLWVARSFPGSLHWYSTTCWFFTELFSNLGTTCH